jgi:hypothetical protein
MFEDFRIQSRVIGYTSINRSGMDEVKTLFRECPWFAEVIDLEFEVRRNFDGLNGGEVCSDD